MASLYEFWSNYYLFVVVIQILLAIHAIKTGRYFWIWLIVFIPLIGCVVYFIMEVLPTLRSTRSLQSPTNLLDMVMPGREFQRLKDNLELSDTIANRRALAEYYQRHGEFEEAIPLLEGCLRGPFKDDARMHLELAEGHYLAGHYDKARELLAKLKSIDEKFEWVKRDYFLARIFEEEGNRTGALGLYESILPQFSGEEVRVRVGLLLEDYGDTQRARDIFSDVVRRLRRAASHYRREQREWVALAKQGLRRIEQGQTASDKIA